MPTITYTVPIHDHTYSIMIEVSFTSLISDGVQVRPILVANRNKAAEISYTSSYYSSLNTDKLDFNGRKYLFLTNFSKVFFKQNIIIISNWKQILI